MGEDKFKIFHQKEKPVKDEFNHTIQTYSLNKQAILSRNYKLHSWLAEFNFVPFCNKLIFFLLYVSLLMSH